MVDKEIKAGRVLLCLPRNYNLKAGMQDMYKTTSAGCTTIRSKLTKYPESLRVMFSGKHDQNRSH